MGIDYSPNMISIAECKVENTRLVVADVIIDDSMFDKDYNLITCFRFLLNAQPEFRVEILKYLSTKLTDDGLLVIKVHGISTVYKFIPTMLHKIGFYPYRNCLSYFESRRLLWDSNLEVMKIYGLGFIFT